MKEETIKELLAKFNSCPDNWLVSAVHLFSSAELIFDRSSDRYHEQMRSMYSQTNGEDKSIEDSTEYLRIGLLLAGFGFETLFKFCYVKRKQEYVYEEILKSGKIPGEMDTHNLIDLSELIMLSVSSDSKIFLEKLSEHSTWAGRYPSQKNARQFNKFSLPNIWSVVDVDTYYKTQKEVFTLIQLDYFQLKKFGVGLTNHSNCHCSRRRP